MDLRPPVPALPHLCRESGSPVPAGPAYLGSSRNQCCWPPLLPLASPNPRPLPPRSPLGAVSPGGWRAGSPQPIWASLLALPREAVQDCCRWIPLAALQRSGTASRRGQGGCGVGTGRCGGGAQSMRSSAGGRPGPRQPHWGFWLCSPRTLGALPLPIRTAPRTGARRTRFSVVSQASDPEEDRGGVMVG